MSALSEILSGMDWLYLPKLLLQAVPAVLCIMLHEIAHGAAALALGDRTAREAGRLSLNPLRHVDWIGLAMLVFCRIGWAKPVSVDPRRFRHPRRDMALTALAGPASNFLLAALLMLLFGLLFGKLSGSGAGTVVLQGLNTAAYLSISLGLFNLIPFPPLDGSKVLAAFLPERAYGRYLYLERYGMPVLIVLVLLCGRVFRVSPVSAAAEAVYGWFFRIAAAAASWTM